MNSKSIQERLAVLRPLRDSNGRPLLDAVLAAYEDTSRKARGNMQKALADGEFPTLKRHAHTLGGAAATLGMQEIFDRCKELQTQARDEQAECCQRSLTELEAACSHAAVVLDEVWRQLGGPEDGPDSD